MHHHINIELSIRFTSKWHAGSGEGNPLLERQIRKDGRGRPYIPGSTLKGVIRENCEKLSNTLGLPDPPSDPHQSDLSIRDTFYPLDQLASPVDRLFGNKYQGGELYFRDARLRDEAPYQCLSQQSRICRHRRLGTAKDRHLFTSEYAAPLTLQTTIDGYHRHLRCFDQGEPPLAYCLLIAGIMITRRIGGDKSTGGGRVAIAFDSIRYNDAPLDQTIVFDYLNDKEIVHETLSH